ncbi:nitrous oxide reductase accessory protein NosL [Mesorhizobium sp. A623]
MRLRFGTILLAALLALTACQREAEAPPAPFAMTEEAMGRYCGMNILEHAGPKGQVILAKYDEPIWFSSARDTIAFTMLPEEPKDIRAIYVSDMARATNWAAPGANNWVDARKAFFVIYSDARGGMGTAEAVPFSSEEAALGFAKDRGGKIVQFNDIPRDYILEQQGIGGEAPAPGGGQSD